MDEDDTENQQQEQEEEEGEEGGGNGNNNQEEKEEEEKNFVTFDELSKHVGKKSEKEKEDDEEDDDDESKELWIGFDHQVYNLSLFIADSNEKSQKSKFVSGLISFLKPLVGRDVSVEVAEKDVLYVKYFKERMSNYIVKPLQGGIDVPEDKGIIGDNSVIAKGLSMLSKTADGSSHAYVKLTLEDMRINSVASISGYKHLQVVNLSGNYLTDVSPLFPLRFIISLNLSNNHLTSFNIDTGNKSMSDKENDGSTMTPTPFPYLQFLDLSRNRLQSLLKNEKSEMKNKYLRRIVLNDNELKEINGIQKLPSLEILEANNNCLVSMPCLPTSIKYVTLCNNKISSLRVEIFVDNNNGSDENGNNNNNNNSSSSVNASKLINLRALFMDDNSITSLKVVGDDGVDAKEEEKEEEEEEEANGDNDVKKKYKTGVINVKMKTKSLMPRLAKLSLKRCNLTQYHMLQDLRLLPSLENLDVDENPMCEEEVETSEIPYFIEVLMMLPSLVVIDGMSVTEEQRGQANELSEERKAEKEALQREAEEAERLEAEQRQREEEEELAGNKSGENHAENEADGEDENISNGNGNGDGEEEEDEQGRGD